MLEIPAERDSKCCTCPQRVLVEDQRHGRTMELVDGLSLRPRLHELAGRPLKHASVSTARHSGDERVRVTLTFALHFRGHATASTTRWLGTSGTKVDERNRLPQGNYSNDKPARCGFIQRNALTNDADPNTYVHGHISRQHRASPHPRTIQRACPRDWRFVTEQPHRTLPVGSLQAQTERTHGRPHASTMGARYGIMSPTTSTPLSVGIVSTDPRSR